MDAKESKHVVLLFWLQVGLAVLFALCLRIYWTSLTEFSFSYADAYGVGTGSVYRHDGFLYLQWLLYLLYLVSIPVSLLLHLYPRAVLRGVLALDGLLLVAQAAIVLQNVTYAARAWVRLLPSFGRKAGAGVGELCGAGAAIWGLCGHPVLSARREKARIDSARRRAQSILL